MQKTLRCCDICHERQLIFPRVSGLVSSGALSSSLPVLEELEELGGASELRRDIDSIPKVCQCTPRGDVIQDEGCGNKK